MKKQTLNLITNTVSLLSLGLVVSTGLIMKFVLPPGTGGRHGGHALTHFGLSRHEWGDIHLKASLVFIVLMVLHIYLHWNWVVCVAWGNKVKPLPLYRRVISIAIALFILLAIAFPWIK